MADCAAQLNERNDGPCPLNALALKYHGLAISHVRSALVRPGAQVTDELLATVSGLMAWAVRLAIRRNGCSVHRYADDWQEIIGDWDEWESHVQGMLRLLVAYHNQGSSLAENAIVSQVIPW
jgi:hypothetical protein